MTRNYRRIAVTTALIVTCCSIVTVFAAADDPTGTENPIPEAGTYDFRGVWLHDSYGLYRSSPEFPLGSRRLDLLRYKEVQDDLQLTGDQKDSIAMLEDKARESFLLLDGVSPEQAQAKIQQRQAEKVDGLLDAKQKARLNEIYLQRLGVQALENKEVVEVLKLTDHQVKEIKDLKKACGEAIGKAVSHHSDREIIDKLRTEYIDKIMAVLTDEQRANFAQMKGKELPMPPR